MLVAYFLERVDVKSISNILLKGSIYLKSIFSVLMLSFACSYLPGQGETEKGLANAFLDGC